MELPERAAVRGPTFIRLLARLSQADVPPSGQALSDRLSQWIDWAHAVALSTALDARPTDADVAAYDRTATDADDCARVAEELGTLLDVEDVIAGGYTFEVSSPGLDRPLRNADDYRRFAGRWAKIVTSEPVQRQTAFAGRVKGIEGDDVLFESEGKKLMKLPLRLITRARLEVEF